DGGRYGDQQPHDRVGADRRPTTRYRKEGVTMSCISDAWGTVKGWAGDAWGYVSGKEDAQTVQAPEIDESRFALGRGRNRHSSEAMADRFLDQALAMSKSGQSALRREAAEPASLATQQGRLGFQGWRGQRQAIRRAAGADAASPALAQLQAGQDAALR